MYEKIVRELGHWIRQDEGLFDPAAFALKGKPADGKILMKTDSIDSMQEYVFSGGEVVKNLLSEFGISANFELSDGGVIDRSIIGQVNGDAYNVLICERTFLNVLSLMSATATKVRKLVKLFKQSGCGTRVAATRKVIPLFGELQKLAVLHGGGDTHRLNLSETAMIKDNHKKLYGSIKAAVTQIRKVVSFTKKIEVEIESEEELIEALESNVDIIMLDNFTPEEARRLAKLARAKRPAIIIEVSGGISEDSVSEFLCDEIDVVSIGKLTSEVEYVDFSLEIEQKVEGSKAVLKSSSRL